MAFTLTPSRYCAYRLGAANPGCCFLVRQRAALPCRSRCSAAWRRSRRRTLDPNRRAAELAMCPHCNPFLLAQKPKKGWEPVSNNNTLFFTSGTLSGM